MRSAQEETAVSTGKSNRPVERAARQGVLVRGEHDDVAGGLLEFGFLPLPPGPPEPGWWDESRVEQGNDREDRQGEPEPNAGGRGKQARQDRGEENGDDPDVAKAKGTHPGPLHHGATAGGEPESNAWLADTPTPHHDEGGGGNQLERPWGSAPEDRLDPDFER